MSERSRPRLPVPADRCPDCAVPIGTKHKVDCEVAICILTGGQRILHHTDPPPPTAEFPGLDAHTCGEDVWTGHRHGVIEAVAYGLFVRPATSADAPLSGGWVPCEPDDDGAVPDLDRIVRTGRWNPIRQRWELAPEVAGCG